MSSNVHPDHTPEPSERADLIARAKHEVDATGVERPDPDTRPIGETAGDRIDRFELISPAGEGGMGSVWLAQQSEPVERKVALKIIKIGMDTREVIARFEAERQALALMNHPYIARVLDGGVTAEGRPYFVMDFVDGAPITEFCDTAELDLRERLELFRQVCEAVQHAHQKGVIHRDLKPSNVLVTEISEKHVPKVIDFGIAKATDAKLTKKTLLTEHAQVIGTPEYMAPEQAGTSNTDIDTRADVYSLGVLLYELLTGTKPLDATDALRDGYLELLRRIREEDPPRPSTRVSTLSFRADERTPIGHTDTTTLSKRLRGDLDWIVMKALEKDRTRRYDSADAFAADIARFLEGDPVIAAPPSAKYRLQKFARRHRGAVIAALSIFAVLVAGTIGTGVGLWKALTANEALDRAVKQEKRLRTAALESEQRARDAEQREKKRADELEDVASFQASQLSDLDVELMGQRLRHAMLDEVDESETETRNALSNSLVHVNFTNVALASLEQNIFDRAIATADESFADQPTVHARLLATTGATLDRLGLAERGLDPLQRALDIYTTELGKTDPATLRVEGRLADLFLSIDRLDDSLARYKASFEGLRDALGKDHPDVLTAQRNVGVIHLERGELDDAEPYLVEALEGQRTVLGAGDQATLATWNAVGELRKLRGDYEESLRITREVLDEYRSQFGSEWSRTLNQAKRVGELLCFLDRQDEAESYVREALDGSRRVLGDDHPATLRALNDLGNLLRDLGRLDEAEGLLLEALERKRAALGENHTSTMISVNNVGLLLEARGKREEAHGYFVETRRICMETLSERHQYSLTAAINLSRSLGRRGDFDEAVDVMTRAGEVSEDLLGAEHPTHRIIVYRRAIILQNAERFEEAREGFAKSVEAYRDAPAGQRIPLGRALMRQGACLVDLERHAEAEPLLREGLAVVLNDGGERPGQIATYRVILANALVPQGRVEEAITEATAAGESMTGSGAAEAEGVLTEVVEFFRALHEKTPNAGYDEQATAWEKQLETYDGDGG